jgi:hypothetical protein
MTSLTVELEPGLPSQGGMGCFIRDTLTHAGLGASVLQVTVVFPRYGKGDEHASPHRYSGLFVVEVQAEAVEACLAALSGPAFKRAFATPVRHLLERSGKNPAKASETPAEDLTPDPTAAP